MTWPCSTSAGQDHSGTKGNKRSMRIFGENLSVSWENPIPLKKEPRIAPWSELLTPAQKEALPFETFPIIDDFEVVLLPTPPLLAYRGYGRKDWGYHLGFFSQQRGLLAYFGLFGCAGIDYSQDNFTGIPLDFWDREQGWEQIIFERGDYIYVLEGDVDDDTSGYHCWFRVRTERYLAEWQLALEACRRIIRQVEGMESFFE